MTDPKRTIEKITRQVKNPVNAAFLEQVEQTGHLEDIKEGLKPTTKVTSFIQHFLDEVKPKRGEDYLTDEEMKEIKEEAKGEQGEKGQDGKTPEFGKDYFTPEHINQIKEGIKQEVTPVYGTDYHDGADGVNGTNGLDADEDRIIQSVLQKIPKPKDGISPKIQDIVKETIKHLSGLKGNDRPSLKMFREADDLIGTVSLHKNIMRNMPKSLIDGDQRWGGHGGSSSGGGFTILPTTVVPNGSTQVFTFLTATAQPSLICIDGAFTPAVDNLGATQWTWVQATQTATLINNAPNSSIFAIA